MTAAAKKQILTASDSSHLNSRRAGTPTERLALVHGRNPWRYVDLSSYGFVRKLCQDRGVTLRAVLSPDRHKYITMVRHELMALVYASTDLSLPEVGRAFQRDHTTCISGIRKHEARLMAEFGQ